jgi:lipid A 3-O-deacylase
LSRVHSFNRAPVLLALALIFTTPAVCAHAGAPSGTFTTVFENDLFYRADRDYTNGIEFNWSPTGSASEQLTEFLANMTPGLLPRNTTRVNYSLGQMMFTPEDTAAYDPPLTQRPYAGYLYGALALTSIGPGTEEQLRIQLGAIGPASLAADSQDLVHRIRGFALPQGWHTQLRDEPGVVVSYQVTKEAVSLVLPGDFAFDVKGNAGGAIGNVFDYASAGAMARIGINMPGDGGPPQIEPGRPSSYYYDPKPGLGAYVFAGIQGRAVARNLFLDGNSFQDSRSVEKENFVGEVSFGGALDYERFRLSFVHVIRSREYQTQPGFDQFGTLSLAVNL